MERLGVDRTGKAFCLAATRSFSRVVSLEPGLAVCPRGFARDNC